MKQYRTQEQFNDIVENVINGNWTDAAKQCVEYGFYAHDLIKFHNDSIDTGEWCFDDLTDIAQLAEMAERLRHQK